jgi:hypothetical protein
MADNVTTEERKGKAPSMEEMIAMQRRRLEEARKTMHEAAEDPENRETLDKGKGHEGGSCLTF